MPGGLEGWRCSAKWCCSAGLGVVLLGGPRVLAQPGALVSCIGDCGGNGVVSVDELITGVRIALAIHVVNDCASFDANRDGRVAVDELVTAVRAALEGCVVPTPTQVMSPATATAAITPTATPTSTPRRPNFIIIELDDIRADAIDRMPVVQARLVGEGVTFRNAFVSDAICCPSRASLFSGLYAVHHGTRGLAGPIGGAHTFRESQADRQTIAVWLQESGYQTGLFGKYLNAYDVTEEGRGPNGTFYVPPGWDRWRAMRSPEHYGGLHGPTYVLVDEGGVLTSYADHTTDEQYSTNLLAREMRAFIVEGVNADKPFFAVWAPYAGHADLPNLQPHPADRHLDAFRGLLPLWRPPNWNEDDVTDKPRWVQDLPRAPVLAAVTDEARRHQYETLLAVDEQLGLTLDLLAELGVDQETVILLTSDNGVSWGEQGYFGLGKACPYEYCIRVPMVVRYPRLAQTEPRTVAASVVNIDIAPTVAALAGVAPPVPVDGLSFAPWLAGSSPTPWREHFLLEFWTEVRSDFVAYSGQVSDGDRLRLLHGKWRRPPRLSTVFEFDVGDGLTEAGALAVPIGSDAEMSFFNLGEAVVAHVDATARYLDPARQRLTIGDLSASHDAVYWIVEVDHGGVMDRRHPLHDYFGVRDVARGYTYVEHITGEVELYDLNADPAQLRNRADDSTYARVRRELARDLARLLGE